MSKTKKYICTRCGRVSANAQGHSAHERWHDRQGAGESAGPVPSPEPVAAIVPSEAIPLAGPATAVDPIEANVLTAIGQAEDRIRGLKAELEAMSLKQTELYQLEAKLKILLDTKDRLFVVGQPEAARVAA